MLKFVENMPFIFVVLFSDIGQCCRPARKKTVSKIKKNPDMLGTNRFLDFLYVCMCMRMVGLVKIPVKFEDGSCRTHVGPLGDTKKQ